MATIKEIIPSEHEEQCLLFEWAAYMKHKHPELGLLFAIPNGGLRNMVVAIQLKAEGVKAGVPDICLPVARGGHHGLYIEMKRKEGSQARTGQREWIRALLNEGYLAVICKGADEAIKTICNYLEVNDGA